MTKLCEHANPFDAPCNDCPRALFSMDQLADIIAGWGVREIQYMVAVLDPDDTIGLDNARTMAGDIFDRRLGITTDDLRPVGVYEGDPIDLIESPTSS